MAENMDMNEGTSWEEPSESDKELCVRYTTL